MLSLLATILSWGDSEREKAGLQRTGPPTSTSGSSTLWPRSSTSAMNSPSKGKAAELDTSDETEVSKIDIV